jgi:hypothetical protein
MMRRNKHCLPAYRYRIKMLVGLAVAAGYLLLTIAFACRWPRAFLGPPATLPLQVLVISTACFLLGSLLGCIVGYARSLGYCNERNSCLRVAGIIASDLEVVLFIFVVVWFVLESQPLISTKGTGRPHVVEPKSLSYFCILPCLIGAFLASNAIPYCRFRESPFVPIIGETLTSLKLV